MAFLVALSSCEARQDEPLVSSIVNSTASKPQASELAALIDQGNSLMDTKQFAEAVEAYGRTLERDPANLDVRVDRGTCYRALGQPEKALAEYAKALHQNPNHVNANRNSGVVLATDLGRNAEAVVYLARYLELVPAATDREQLQLWIQQLKKTNK